MKSSPQRTSSCRTRSAMKKIAPSRTPITRSRRRSPPEITLGDLGDPRLEAPRRSAPRRSSPRSSPHAGQASTAGPCPRDHQVVGGQVARHPDHPVAGGDHGHEWRRRAGHSGVREAAHGARPPPGSASRSPGRGERTVASPSSRTRHAIGRRRERGTGRRRDHQVAEGGRAGHRQGAGRGPSGGAEATTRRPPSRSTPPPPGRFRRRPSAAVSSAARHGHSAQGVAREAGLGDQPPRSRRRIARGSAARAGSRPARSSPAPRPPPRGAPGARPRRAGCPPRPRGAPRARMDLGQRRHGARRGTRARA